MLNSKEQLLGVIKVNNGIYELTSSEVYELELNSLIKTQDTPFISTYLLDHYKFGHAPLDVLQRITGKSYKQEVLLCKACAQGKMSVRNFNKKAHQGMFNRKPSRVLTSDTHGPYPISIDGKKFWTSLACKDTGRIFIATTFLNSGLMPLNTQPGYSIVLLD